MRRRLGLTVLAVTAMVTIAFLIPLALIVRVAASDRALSAADQEARSLASVLASVRDANGVATVIAQLDAGSGRSATAYLPGGAVVGAVARPPASELAIARGGRAFTASSNGETRVWSPVRRADGSVAVGLVVVPNRLLHRGVATAWWVLVAVGLVVLALAVALADRLASATVASIERLGEVTERLRAGDLDARVEPSGPPEVVAVGQAVNQLATRITERLADERESAADLSHRLRTPLTGLQLEADRLRSKAERARVTAAVAELTEAVNAAIRDARQPAHGAELVSDLGTVVEERMAFWSVLAADQERSCEVDRGTAARVLVSPADLAAAVDALVANVFAHTPTGVALRVTVRGASLTVEDDGPGYPFRGRPRRGRSASGSTGLGLDIVRRTAERSGGGLALGAGSGGGARAVVTFGLAPQ